MKAMNTMLALMVATGVALAQAPATNKPKAPASQSVAGQAAPAPKPSATTAAPKPSAKTPAKPAKAPTTAAKAPAAKKAPTPAAAPASAVEAKKPTGKRDPFVSPVVRAGGPGAVCATGKRCLIISDMILRGIVRTPSGMIAVVSNQANRAYFLKENDPVFNGMVVKITGDSVVFKENTIDNLGHETTREVVKRVSAPTV